VSWVAVVAVTVARTAPNVTALRPATAEKPVPFTTTVAPAAAAGTRLVTTGCAPAVAVSSNPASIIFKLRVNRTECVMGRKEKECIEAEKAKRWIRK
jgi:hypothetical protein